MMQHYSSETYSPSEMSVNIVRLYAYSLRRINSNDGLIKIVCTGEA